MKILSILICVAFNVCLALEFGSMGNTPASVGGAGVAYKKNSWALHYNPALLGVNRKANIAYSFGVGYGENNLAQLATIDYNSMQNIPDNIIKLSEGKSPLTSLKATSLKTSSLRARTSSVDYSSLGLISDVLKNITHGSLTSGITDEDTLKKYIDEITGQTGSDISDSIKKLQALDDKTAKFQEIKKDISLAVDKVAQSNSSVGILKSIIDNIDVDNMGGLIETLKDSGKSGSFDFSKLLSAIGGVTINRGANSFVDNFLDDYAIINKSMQDNSLNIHSNNGIVFHIAGGKERGAIGFGVLTNIYGYESLLMDKTHNKIIIKNGSNYYEVDINNNHMSLKPSDENGYNNSSIISPNAKHSLYANNIMLLEVPIAYGHTIPSLAGDFHIGATLKYIHAISVYSNQIFNLENINLKFDLKDNMRQTNTFGVDIGGLYTIGGFSLGFVGKNLNAPKINTTDGKMRLDRQFRAGVGFEIWRFTLLLDLDLVPNTTLDPYKKNQMLGGGIIFDASWVDFRLGAMRDLRANPYGTIITAGMNIVNFIDISVQSSLVMRDIDKYRLPNYLDVRIGGRFLF